MLDKTAGGTQGIAKGEPQAASITNRKGRVCGHGGGLLLICNSGTSHQHPCSSKLKSIARIRSAAFWAIHLSLQHLILIRRDVTGLRVEKTRHRHELH